MAVVAFVRAEPGFIAETAGAPGWAGAGASHSKVQSYGRTMAFGFILVLASWIVSQIGCLLTLFMHFHSGIVAGTIDGSLAFKFWPPVDYFSPDHAASHAFVPRIFPLSVSIAFSLILIVASAPFCVSLIFLAELFRSYSRGEVFTRRNAMLMRWIGHSLLATGYSPIFLGPLAHAIGVLKPVTGITDGMIVFIFLGATLLTISHVMQIGERLQQDQESIL